MPASNKQVGLGEIWVDKYIKEQFLKNDLEVRVSEVRDQSYQAQLVECVIKDCYVSRRDMLIFRDEMDGKFVSENQRITLSTSSTDNFRSTHIQISRIYGQTGQRLKRGARVTD